MISWQEAQRARRCMMDLAAPEGAGMMVVDAVVATLVLGVMRCVLYKP